MELFETAAPVMETERDETDRIPRANWILKGMITGKYKFIQKRQSPYRKSQWCVYGAAGDPQKYFSKATFLAISPVLREGKHERLTLNLKKIRSLSGHHSLKKFYKSNMKKASSFNNYKFDKTDIAMNPDIEFLHQGKLVDIRILMAQHQLGYSTGFAYLTLNAWPHGSFSYSVACNKGTSFPKKEDALYDAATQCFVKLKDLFDKQKVPMDELMGLHQYIIDLNAGAAPDFLIEKCDIKTDKLPAEEIKNETDIPDVDQVEELIESTSEDPADEISPTAGEKQPEEQETTPIEKGPNTSTWKCRVCGCTDDNCAICIRTTGQPCHWVEENLCSACVDQPKEIKSQTGNTMDFFQQLAAAGHVDFTFRILQKNKNLTINILPGGTPRTLLPMNFTATPKEMDRVFFENIVPAVQEVHGLVSNIAAVKAQAADLPKEEEKSNPSARPSKTSQIKAANKARKSAQKKTAKAKPEKKKPAAPAAPDMFPEEA